MAWYDTPLAGEDASFWIVKSRLEALRLARNDAISLGKIQKNDKLIVEIDTLLDEWKTKEAITSAMGATILLYAWRDYFSARAWELAEKLSERTGDPNEIDHPAIRYNFGDVATFGGITKIGYAAILGLGVFLLYRRLA